MVIFYSVFILKIPALLIEYKLLKTFLQNFWIIAFTEERKSVQTTPSIVCEGKDTFVYSLVDNANAFFFLYTFMLGKIKEIIFLHDSFKRLCKKNKKCIFLKF